MRNVFLCVYFVLALPQFAPGQQGAATDKAAQHATSKDTPADPKLAGLLEGKVRAAWAAFQKKDKTGYGALLTDDFQAVESDGDGERTKMQTLREVEHPLYTSYSLQLFQVQPLGQQYAFVTYESTMQFPKGSIVRFRRVFVGELWTNRDGDWKMMRYQETVVR
jgi:hypothetical protein